MGEGLKREDFMKKEAREQTTVSVQKPLSMILDEIQQSFERDDEVDSAQHVPALVKALRRAMEILENATGCNPLCGRIAVNDITAILNQK